MKGMGLGFPAQKMRVIRLKAGVKSGVQKKNSAPLLFTSRILKVHLTHGGFPSLPSRVGGEDDEGDGTHSP